MNSINLTVNQQKERNPMIDIISGLFILEIIIQHLLQNTGFNDGSFFDKYVIRYLIVFMPWFYFKAGIMFKEIDDIKNAISQRTRKLIYPFIIWSLIPTIAILPLYIANNDTISWLRCFFGSLFYGEGPFNTPLWFLPSLLFVYILFYTNILKDKWIYLFILGIASWALSCCIRLPLGINNLPLGCFFFLLGIKFRSLNIKINSYVWSFILCIYILMMTYWYSPVGFRSNSLSGNSYLLYLIETSLLLFVLFKIINLKIRNRVLEYLGRYSIMFYVSHAPVIIILKYYKENFFLQLSNSNLLILMIVGITVVFAFLILLREKIDFLFQYPNQR